MSSVPPDPPLKTAFPSAEGATGEAETDVRSFRLAALARALGGRIDGDDLSDWDLAVLRWIDLRLTRIQRIQGDEAARNATDQVIEILREGAGPLDDAGPP